MSEYVCVCVCVRERERERLRKGRGGGGGCSEWGDHRTRNAFIGGFEVKKKN